jgi:hypothetical protein
MTQGDIFMRRMTVQDGLTVRFPGRSAEFDEGFEIGVLAASMAAGLRRFDARIGRDALEQARAFAQGFGYRAIESAAGEDWVALTFMSGAQRPRLRLVSGSAG